MRFQIFQKKIWAVAVALLLLAPPYAVLLAAEWEYDWDEGLHREEWYDPSDWFNSDAGIDYESDWWDFTYGYNYYDPYDYDTDARGYFGDGASGGYDYAWYADNDYYYNYYTDAWYEDDFVWYGTEDDVYDFAYLDENKKIQKVEGTVKEMKDFKLGGLEQKNMFAKLETQNGRTVRVDLGPLSEARKAKIDVGDKITVSGTRGSINDRPMFVALSIKSPSGDLKVNRQFDENMKKLQAKVLETRKTSFKKADKNTPEQVFARIQVEKGPMTIINLGSADKLPKDTELQGKQVALLARPVKIGDKRALVAEEIHVDGKTIDTGYSVIKQGASGKGASKGVMDQGAPKGASDQKKQNTQKQQ